jgi:3-oxoacyl-[acyl-carrier protein] reductase
VKKLAKFVLITGASGGIGRKTAELLARNGWNLYLHYYINKKEMDDLAKELSKYPVEVIPIQADLTNSAGANQLTESIFEIDAVVHASGVSKWGLFQDHSESDMDDLWNIHVKSPMIIIQKLLEKLIRVRGKVVIVSSIWGQTGAACEVLYSTVKGAQLSFVKSFSKEIARNGVRVNAIAPGAVNTDMLNSFTEEELEDVKEDIPMGRLANSEEIASAIRFLLSDEASYITGQVLAVNGGWYT